MLFQRIFKTLGELLDTSISSPADGDVLTYDGDLAKWTNQSGGASSSTLTLINDSIIATVSTLQNPYPVDGEDEIGTGLQNVVDISVNVPTASPAATALSFNSHVFIDGNGSFQLGSGASISGTGDTGGVEITDGSGATLTLNSNESGLELDGCPFVTNHNDIYLNAGVDEFSPGGAIQSPSAINFSSGASLQDDNAGGIICTGTVTVENGAFDSLPTAVLSVTAGNYPSNPYNVCDISIGGFNGGEFPNLFTVSGATLVDSNGHLYGNGAYLTSLNASSLTTGTVADARLSSNVVLKSTTSGTTPAHSTATSTAGSGTGVFTNTLFAGNTGSTSYSLNDVVSLLKAAGIAKA